MRLSVCCLAGVCFSLSLFATHKTWGQGINDSKITVSIKNESLKNAIQKLQDASGFIIFYPSAKVEAYKHVSLNAESRTVAEALTILLAGTRLGYQETNGKVVVFERKENDNQLIKRITGIIRDENKDPIPGVTIQSKLNRRTSTATDKNGIFHLDVEAEEDILIITLVGYKKQEIPVKNKTSFEINMVPDAGILDEIQVIGYGTTTRRENTGSVSSLTAKDIGKQVIDNPLAALQGRIAGLQITQDNGNPGAALRVNIRGAFTGVSDAGYIPLYVVDGVPFTLFNGQSPASDNLNANGTNGANGGVSPFSMIPPEDIERIDVLKDADATAIYGSRGANGVILITTKKGKNGSTNMNFNVNHGVANVGYYIPMMNTQEYLQLRKEAFANANVIPTTANALDLTVWDQNASTDWQKWLIGHTARTTTATGTVSGGNAQNNFMFTSTYRKQGTVYGADYGATSFSGRITAGHKSANRKFKIDGSVNYSFSDTNLPTTDLAAIYNLPPNFPLYNANGTINFTVTSPLSYYMRTIKSQAYNMISNVNLSYQVLPGLTLRSNLGYTSTRYKQKAVNPASAQNSTLASANRLIYTDNDNTNYIIEPQADYNVKLGDGNLQALVGTTFQSTKATGIYLQGVGYSTESLINSLLGASTLLASNNNASTYKYNATFARLNYNWKEKYIANATFRRDGSSRFGDNNKYGNFGAIGAAWIYTQEDWMKNLSFLSFGKLRASYGLTGNDQIPNYIYTSVYSASGSTFNYDGVNPVVPNALANPDLHWETTKKLDIALEFGLFKDRIYFKTDFYRNRVSDILTAIVLPGQAGYSSYTGNLGAKVQNQGFEFELNTMNITRGDFKWSTNFNLTINRNKLLAFDDIKRFYYAGSFVVGQPTTLQMIYHYTGNNPTTGAPTYQDKDGNGTVTFANDRFVAPYGHPYYGGITNSLSYKGFSLDFSFQYTHRYGFTNATLSNQFNPAGFTYANASTAVLDRWTAPGATGLFPAASTITSTPYGFLYNSDFNWGDASFLKLRNVSINYSIPRKALKQIGFSNATVFLQGQNLHTWAKQKYVYDPESAVVGGSLGTGAGTNIALPQLRTIIVGLNCSF